MADKEIIRMSFDEILAGLKREYGQIRSAHGFVAVVKALAKAVPAVVAGVELHSKRLGIKGADKQKLAIDVILAFVKLPWWLPDGLARGILAVVIDMAVAAINRSLKK